MDNDKNSNKPLNNLTKNFEKPSPGVLICGGVMIICAILYAYIVMDTISNKTNTVTVIDKTPSKVEEQKPEINIDEIDAQTLTLTDSTITNNANYIINADYTVEGIDYFIDSFRIPYINFNTDDAKFVNNEIKSYAKEWAKTSAKYKKTFEGLSLDASPLIRSNYEVFNFDNVVSVLITFTTREDSLETNKYYSYSFNTSHALIESTEVKIEGETQNIPLENAEVGETYLGRRITFDDILKMKNLNFEDVDKKYQEVLSSYSGEYGEQESITQTLENYQSELNSGKLGAFLDNDGRLNIIGKIINSNYKNGTYRIFRYVDGSFISTTMIND